MWVRGLKHNQTGQNSVHHHVAPHVGAWIETYQQWRSAFQYKVAPHVGAWIETLISANAQKQAKSHPMWVRGLKRMSL